MNRMMKRALFLVMGFLMMASLVSADHIDCSRDYGGRVVIGECWYVANNGLYYKLTDIASLQWEGGLEGSWVFNMTEATDPYGFKIRPYILDGGNYYTLSQVKQTYPNLQFAQLVKGDNDFFKWDLNVSWGVTPPAVDIAMVLDDHWGLQWSEIELVGGSRIRVKDTVLDYGGMGGEGRTLQLFNKTVFIVRNITEWDFDPHITLDNGNSSIIADTYTRNYGGDADTNYGGSGGMCVAHRSNIQRRFYMMWNTTILPTDVYIYNATIYLYQYYEATGTNYDVKVYYANDSQNLGYTYDQILDEDVITWNNRNNYRVSVNNWAYNLQDTFQVQNNGNGQYYPVNVTDSINRTVETSSERSAYHFYSNEDAGSEEAVCYYTKENGADNPYMDVYYSGSGGTLTLSEADVENLDDVYIQELASTLNYGGSTIIRLNNGTNDELALFRWNISQLPAGATIDSAELRLTANSESLEAGEWQNISVISLWENYSVTANGNWTEGNKNNAGGVNDEVEYSNRPDDGEMGDSICGSLNISDGGVISGGVYNWTVTDCLQEQVDKSYENFSLIMFVPEYGGGVTNDPIDFRTKEYSGTTSDPVLNIVYSEGTTTTSTSTTTTTTTSTTTTILPWITFFDLNETNSVLQGTQLVANITIDNGTEPHDSIGFTLNTTVANRTNTYINGSNYLLLLTDAFLGNYSIVAWVNDTGNNINWSNTTAGGPFWLDIYTTTSTTTTTTTTSTTVTTTSTTSTTTTTLAATGMSNFQPIYVSSPTVFRNITVKVCSYNGECNDLHEQNYTSPANITQASFILENFNSILWEKVYYNLYLDGVASETKTPGYLGRGDNLYGEMWNYTSGGYEVTLADSGVYYNLTGLVEGNNNGFNFTCAAQNEGGCYLTSYYGGLYSADLHISGHAVAAGDTYGISIAKNFDHTLSRNCYINLDGSGDIDVESISCLIDLDVNDTLNVKIEDEGNPTKNFDIHSINLNLVKVGW